MKKPIAFIFIIINLLHLSGCSVTEAITSDKQEYIVCALGFDSENGEIKMSAEAVVVNTDDLSEDKESKLFSAMGKTVKEAYGKIMLQITQPLSLGHSGVAVMGRSLSHLQIKEIFEFLNHSDKLNIAIRLVCSENAYGLLSCEEISSVAVGYDIMSMLEVGEEKRGTVLKNRLYEVQSQRLMPLRSYYLPYIGTNGEKIFLEGIAAFKDNTSVRILDNEEAVLFCLVTDSLKAGEIQFKKQSFKISHAKTRYSFNFDEKLEITLKIRLMCQGDKKALMVGIKDFLQGCDICSLGNVLSQKKPEIWEKINKNYESYYKNADIKVEIYE